MAKPKLLYLCHRIPYPPNKGDKIRSFNLLKALSACYDVYLGCFVDDDFDWQYVDKLADWCVEYKCVKLNPTMAKLRGLTAFLTGNPITLPYYANNELQHWVHQTIDKYKIKTAMVFSSSMAQYIDHPKYAGLHRVLDFVDVDSDKWRQYAEKQSGIMSWVYMREFRQLQRIEQHYCHTFNYSLFVSDDEADMFRHLMPAQLSQKIQPLLNGVDVEFFNPARTVNNIDSPLQQPFLVFTGAMDYWANVDAVLWFSLEVWPLIKQQRPDLSFYIVGGNPTQAVKELHSVNDIYVTGRVQDVRPYIAAAELVVAPLRIARGIQNKVLEAMSMNKAVVATSMAIEGINAPAGQFLNITDEPQDFAGACLQLLQPVTEAPNNRAWILTNFTWEAKLAPLYSLLTSRES